MREVALITGGASGIGAAFARLLARRGAHVVLADRQIEEARSLAAEIARAGGSAGAVELDVRDVGQFEDVAREAHAAEGRIDYLFNNAGIGVAGDVLHYGLDDWFDVFNVNLRGVVHGVHAVYPLMCRQGSGHIINTASMAGLIPSGEAVSYATTKHAVVGLSKALRLEAGLHGVRVSALCPGVVRTPILTAGKFGRLNMRDGAETKVLELWERLRPMDVDVFAKKALRAIDRNRPIIIEPAHWRLFYLLERVSPRLSLWLWAKLYVDFRRELEPYRLSDE
ncbi:MAG: SDR family oxidoreductase [Myxococcota bacterium]